MEVANPRTISHQQSQSFFFTACFVAILYSLDLARAVEVSILAIRFRLCYSSWRMSRSSVLLATTVLLKFLDVIVELIQVLSLDLELLSELFQAMYAVSVRNDIPASEVLPFHLLLPNELVLCSCFSLGEGITVRRKGERVS